MVIITTQYLCHLHRNLTVTWPTNTLIYQLFYLAGYTLCIQHVHREVSLI